MVVFAARGAPRVALRGRPLPPTVLFERREPRLPGQDRQKLGGALAKARHSRLRRASAGLLRWSQAGGTRSVTLRSRIRTYRHPMSASSIDLQPATSSERLDFSEVYRDNVGPLTRFFARRCRDPEVVSDLTAETFVEALASADSFAGRGSIGGWLIAIARAVYARHCVSQVQGRQLAACLTTEFHPTDAELMDLVERIDAESRGRDLLAATARLREVDRLLIELVDLMDFTPTEAARVLGISAGTARVRMFRAHARLRKESGHAGL